jgi:hypothetical protein
MNLPQLDLAALPGLDNAVGVFGSAMGETATYSDSIVAIMVYIYEAL